MRILCLNYEYPPVGGGGGRAAEQINTAFVARGHAVRVQTAGLRHLPAHETRDGVEIFRSQSFRRREDTCTVPEMALFLATSFLPTLRHIRTWRPDVIHAHFAVPTGALALAAATLTRTPYVLTAHLGDVPGGVPEQTAGLFRLVQPLTVPIWRCAAGVTAVSSFVADLAHAAYGIRPEVIPNGMAVLPRPTIHLAQPPRIIIVGRLSEQKNPVLAVDALGRIADLNWEFVVIGDGPLRASVEQAVARAGLTSRTRFTGWLDAPTVQRELSAADILLLTSHSEGLPMVALEALNHGLAIVSTDIGGVADVVNPGQNGVLTPANPDAISAALRSLLTNPAQLQTFRAASADRAPEFALERIADRYLEALRRAVEVPSSS